MPKRSRPHHPRPQDRCNQDDDFFLPSECDSDDWEYTPKKARLARNAVQKKSTTNMKMKPEDQTRETAQQSRGVLEVRNSLHPRSRHSIQNPGPLRIALLRWFATVKDSRGMPWRKSFDFSQGSEERSQRAYEVWVSEVMLQQTQVATVIPYYNRWMETFPTLKDLVSQISPSCIGCRAEVIDEAQADVDEVYALWKGLGYYSRARRLLEGAKKIMNDYDGVLPTNAKEMQQKIPGIGRYSAGAICSIAYGERAPVLDGNVHRLFSRFLALYAPPKGKATLDILWDAAKVMVQEDGDDDESQMLHPGDINQALIELGSTICRARDPSCHTCPLQPWCSAHELSCGRETSILADIEEICGICDPIPQTIEVTKFPMKVVRRKVKEELDIVNVIEWRCDISSAQRFFLLVRRPESGLLAGLYDFVTSVNVPKNISSRSVEAASLQRLATMFRGLPVEHKPLQSETPHDCGMGKFLAAEKPVIAGDVLHTFSHIKKTYRVVWVVITGGKNAPEYCADIEVKDPSDKVGNGETDATSAAAQEEIRRDANSPMDYRWTTLDQVADANMGTGSMKIWNLARGLWTKSALPC